MLRLGGFELKRTRFIRIQLKLARSYPEGVRAMAADGLVTVVSKFDPSETLKRLDAVIGAMGMTLFARIDHAAGARDVGMDLRPTVLLIFGSAKAGTPLMQADQAVGIDLPLKTLVWQDGDGRTWVSYNDPGWIAKRHGIGETVKLSVQRMETAIAEVSREAAGSK